MYRLLPEHGEGRCDWLCMKEGNYTLVKNRDDHKGGGNVGLHVNLKLGQV